MNLTKISNKVWKQSPTIEIIIIPLLLNLKPKNNTASNAKIVR